MHRALVDILKEDDLVAFLGKESRRSGTGGTATNHDGVTGLNFTCSSHDWEEFGMISRIRAKQPPSAPRS